MVTAGFLKTDSAQREEWAGEKTRRKGGQEREGFVAILAQGE